MSSKDTAGNTINYDYYRTGDDCVKFAMAVYNDYLKGTITDQFVFSHVSRDFASTPSQATIYNNYKLKAYKASEITASGLQRGDILVAEAGDTCSHPTKKKDDKITPETVRNSYGHLELYYDDTHRFGWGNVNVNYPVGAHWYDVDGGKIFDSNIGLVYSYVLRKED